MSKYDKVIERVFFKNYTEGAVKVVFDREELATACQELGISRIKNLGDISYKYRFRRELPKSIKEKSLGDQIIQAMNIQANKLDIYDLNNDQYELLNFNMEKASKYWNVPDDVIAKRKRLK